MGALALIILFSYSELVTENLQKKITAKQRIHEDRSREDCLSASPRLMGAVGSSPATVPSRASAVGAEHLGWAKAKLLQEVRPSTDGPRGGSGDHASSHPRFSRWVWMGPVFVSLFTFLEPKLQCISDLLSPFSEGTALFSLSASSATRVGVLPPPPPPRSLTHFLIISISQSL